MSTSSERIASALEPLRYVLWGENAMGFLGVRFFSNSLMIVSEPTQYELAASRLLSADFTLTPWSYGSCDPAELENDPAMKELHESIIPQYAILDQNSQRFHFPKALQEVRQLVLLQSEYVELSPPTDELATSRYHPIIEGRVYCPTKELLLESFIKAILKGPGKGHWHSTLRVWAISYLFGQLMIEESALDSCDRDDVKAWFNEAIFRDKGGLDRTTETKHLGRG